MRGIGWQFGDDGPLLGRRSLIFYSAHRLLLRVRMRNHRQWNGRRKQRAVTLIEVLIVVAIIALVSASVAVASHKFWSDAVDKDAKSNARTIRSAVKAWWVEHDSALCPSMEQLVSDQILDKDHAHSDPWGKPWRIECADSDVTIYSDGRDRIAGTKDDVRIPPT